LKIKPGSTNGSKMRLKGRGIPASSSSNSTGDLYVILQIVVPPANSDKEKEAYEKMKQSFNFNPRASLGV
jgi:curved DNA-binding protein